MPQLTIEISDELMQRLDPIRDQIPALLHKCLQPSPTASPAYRYILDFLASQPTPEQIATFRPTEEMMLRLNDLLQRSAQGSLTPTESQELDEYEHIEHLIILLKTGNLPYIRS